MSDGVWWGITRQWRWDRDVNFVTGVGEVENRNLAGRLNFRMSALGASRRPIV
jgi:hypothetical protein